MTKNDQPVCSNGIAVATEKRQRASRPCAASRRKPIRAASSIATAKAAFAAAAVWAKKANPIASIGQRGPPSSHTPRIPSVPTSATSRSTRVLESRRSRASIRPRARRQPCREYQLRGIRAKHQSQKQASASPSDPRCGTPSSHAIQGLGEVSSKNSPGAAATLAGKSDQG